MSLQNVVLKRSGKSVLNLSWQVEEGTKQVALIGCNGAGKFSLCRLLNGLLAPNSGLVLVNDQEPRTRCINTLQQVGYMFQNPEHQMICPTVLEEIAFGPAQLGSSKVIAKTAALELLDQHQLSDWADWPVAELSHGQQKLLCLLPLSVNKPAVLVLDEPFAGLDLYTMLHFQNFLAQLSQLQPLSKFGIDSASLALLISLVMRFIPGLLAQWTRQNCSWQARLPQRPSWQLIAPWCLQALNIAEQCDDCLRARAPFK